MARSCITSACDVEEHAGQPAHRLRFGSAGRGHAVRGARWRWPRSLHGVAGLDRPRIDLAREAQHVDVLVDADLLLAGDQQVTVGQHAAHDDRDRAAEVVAVLGGALAFEVVARGAVGGGAREGAGPHAGERGDAGRQRAGLVDRARALGGGADLLDDLHRERVADKARAVVLEQRPVGGGVVDRAGVGHRCRRGGHDHRRGVGHLHSRAEPDAALQQRGAGDDKERAHDRHSGGHS